MMCLFLWIVFSWLISSLKSQAIQTAQSLK